MRLMSPRNTAPYHTLECAPSVTSPMTVAVLAMKTFAQRGCRRRNLSRLRIQFARRENLDPSGRERRARVEKINLADRRNRC